MIRIIIVVLLYIGAMTTVFATPKLCMDTIPKGDKFYAECRKCEKNVRYCSGDLRDRMRELLRQDK